SRRSSTPSFAWPSVPFMRTSTSRLSWGFVARSNNSLSDRRSCSNTKPVGGEGPYHIPCRAIHPQPLFARGMTRLVALTSTTKEIGGMMRVRLNEAYVLAARAAGLTPLVVPPIDPAELGPVLD